MTDKHREHRIVSAGGRKAPGFNRDADIYETYLRNCQRLWDIPERHPGRATPQKYFDINRTAGRGSL